jgi:hypothetical protein
MDFMANLVCRYISSTLKDFMNKQIMATELQKVTNYANSEEGKISASLFFNKLHS